MTTHISYETAKRLKEFCPELPEPMADGPQYHAEPEFKTTKAAPMWQLHDLLSEPFCQEFCRSWVAWDRTIGLKANALPLWEFFYFIISNANRKGGLPAVERLLLDLMKGGK